MAAPQIRQRISLIASLPIHNHVETPGAQLIPKLCRHADQGSRVGARRLRKEVVEAAEPASDIEDAAGKVEDLVRGLDPVPTRGDADLASLAGDSGRVLNGSTRPHGQGAVADIHALFGDMAG